MTTPTTEEDGNVIRFFATCIIAVIGAIVFGCATASAFTSLAWIAAMFIGARIGELR